MKAIIIQGPGVRTYSLRSMASRLSVTTTLRLTTSPTTRTTTVQRCHHRPRLRIMYLPTARSILAVSPSCTTPIRGWPSSDQRCSTSRVETTAIRTQTCHSILLYNPTTRLETSQDHDDRRTSARDQAPACPVPRALRLRLWIICQRRLLKQPGSHFQARHCERHCERHIIEETGQTKRRELKLQRRASLRRRWRKHGSGSGRMKRAHAKNPSIFTKRMHDSHQPANHAVDDASGQELAGANDRTNEGLPKLDDIPQDPTIVNSSESNNTPTD